MIFPNSIWRNAKDVTPSDTEDLENYGTLFLLGGGDVVVTLVGMADGTHVKLGGGDYSYVPGLVKRVWSTGTTATSIVQSIEK